MFTFTLVVFSLFTKHVETFLAVMDWAPRKIVTQILLIILRVQRPSAPQNENPCFKTIFYNLHI